MVAFGTRLKHVLLRAKVHLSIITILFRLPPYADTVEGHFDRVTTALTTALISEMLDQSRTFFSATKSVDVAILHVMEGVGGKMEFNDIAKYQNEKIIS